MATFYFFLLASMCLLCSVDCEGSLAEGLSAVANSSTSLVVTWGMAMSSSIIQYEVMYEPLETFSGTLHAQSVNVSASESSVVLTGLEEFVTYNISLILHSTAQSDTDTMSITVTTFEDSPDGAPSNVAASLSQGIITVRWEEVVPIHQNGIIQFYEVYYQVIKIAMPPRVFAMNTTERSVNLTDVQGFSNYTISVRAYNMAGMGPYSNNVTVESNYSHQVSLASLWPEHLPASAGRQHKLQCNASRSSALPSTTQLEMTWLNPQGSLIDPSSILLPVIGNTTTNNSTLSSMLVFNHVRTSLAGPYTCVVHMSGPGIPANYTVSKTLKFTVKIILTEDDVILNQSRTGDLFSGTLFSIHCFVRLRTAVDTRVNVSITIVLRGIRGYISTGLGTQVGNSSFFLRSVDYNPLTINDRAQPIFTVVIVPDSSSTFVIMSELVPKLNHTMLNIQALPAPRVVVSSSHESGAIVGDDVQLTCAALVVSHLAVPPIIEWMTPNGTHRESILVPIATETGDHVVYMSRLDILSVQSSSGGEYWCNVSIDIPHPDVPAVSMSDMMTLFVEYPEPTTSLFVPDGLLHSNRNETTQLTCNASLSSVVQNSNEIRFNFTWLDISGSVIGNTSRTSVHYPVESVSVLSLFPLSVLDTNISCKVVVDAKVKSDYVLASAAVIVQNFLTIQFSNPHLNITSSPIADHFYPGLQLNLTCFIHLESPLESILTLSTSWSKSGNVLRASEELQTSSLTPLLYQTSLVIRRLDKSSDNGDYVCSARIVSSSNLVLGALADVSKTITVEVVSFQFEVHDSLGEMDCVSLRSDAFANKIVMEVTGILSRRCQCDFTSNLIGATRFKCPHSTFPAVIFRAELYGTPTATVYTLSSILQEWVAVESSTIVFSSIEYLVVNFCNASTEECRTTATSSTASRSTATRLTETSSTETSVIATGAPEDSNLVVIVGGAAGVACVFILAVVSGIVICFIAYSKIRHTPENVREVTMRMNSLNRHCHDNEYEDTSKYCSGIYAEVGDYATIAAAKKAAFLEDDDFDISNYIPMAPAPSLGNVAAIGEVEEMVAKHEGDYATVKL